MKKSFVADGWRIKLAIPLVMWITAGAIWSLSRGNDSSELESILRLTSGISGLGVAAYLAWVLAHRRRPIVEISNDTVEYGSVFWFWTRRTVGLRDLTRVSLKGSRLELTTRSGDALKLWLGDLSRKSREAVRSAIEEGVRAYK